MNLQKVLSRDSADCVEWIIKNFGVDLSIVNRLGGHSYPRVHRGETKFPGMTITMALIKKLE